MRSREGERGRGLGRREVLGLGLGAFVVGLVPLAARRPALVRRSVPVMGTVAEFAVLHPDPARAHAAIDRAVRELERVERLMTRFVETSEVGQVNRRASREPVAVGRETFVVVREALAWAEASDGAFDPSIGRLVGLWDVTHRRTPPARALVGRLAGRRLYRAVDLDGSRRPPTVRFADPEVQLDLGGIAKGYGVDRAVEALRGAGVDRGIVDVGGDLYALGDAPDGGPWRIGIRAAEEPVRLVDRLELRDAAVATSGDYLQYFDHGGRRYHHLLDPATGAPRRTAVRSVTVLAESCLAADAAATAVFGMTEPRAARLLAARAPGARIVHAITGQA